MKIPGGFILKARKTLSNSVLADGPPLYSKLWDWMLMQAFWKDGDNLKRGQFATSTRQMQEAVSWKIGYRKRLPTRQEIRSSYEAFTNNHMINHTKTTRGMVITICNYDIYQNPANYEQPTEQPDGHTTNNQVATHDREEGYKKDKKERKTGDCKQSPVIEPDDIPTCPQKDIVSLYHEILPMCPEVKIWGVTREKLLRTRWKEDSQRQSADWWRRFFGYVSQSLFLTGRTDTDFVADLEWLIRPNNFEKIANGRYHRGAQQVTGKTAQNLVNLQSWLRKKEMENGK